VVGPVDCLLGPFLATTIISVTMAASMHSPIVRKMAFITVL
jgi:hypothetical protein